MINNTTVVLHHSLASQSFEILDDIVDNLENASISEKMSEDFTNVPQNTPSSPKDSYETKKYQIKYMCQIIKLSNRCSKQKKREICALRRHYIKLCFAEKSGILYNDFCNNIIQAYNKNVYVNDILRRLYCG
ncbi:hypothetical protein BMW23_0897 [Bodo saltans virus]|uniref:Uncharacterized protein n=1 Tax=Bodo saltans virus TaxID=2024608 RepID=A0A2H4UVJ6_9VIRU|nr:hypothetical protein QJ851_gp0879 [Bodo saltans virus]ATZ80942.1 hypothetical protein BMW23_0897 [Bodo saltans virus]